MIEGEAIGTTMERALRNYMEVAEGSLPPGFYTRIIRQVERPLIQLCLEQTGGNQLKAAQILGINRNTLRKKIRYLGLDKDG